MPHLGKSDISVNVKMNLLTDTVYFFSTLLHYLIDFLYILSYM